LPQNSQGDVVRIPAGAHIDLTLTNHRAGTGDAVYVLVNERVGASVQSFVCLNEGINTLGETLISVGHLLRLGFESAQTPDHATPRHIAWRCALTLGNVIDRLF
jgi:hypothetical protein